ncbi:MAG: glycine C-acetyltransferase [SAR324 cluster bacterium]|uniref:2-amino-3-ketobutyrate coenzyme A ligase n=1 Tax=SAR324 cluster bacterium TaxID=2024889 RepID=A0A7X9IJS9_9DELT|nr:glycine C-acetyltransferase [SAR324 cluster bacterium]
MYQSSKGIFSRILDEIQEAGTYKSERILQSPQGASITVNGKEVLNFCANNYLGLSNNSDLVNAAKRALDEYGFGLSSVRFICGTQTLHREFERRIAEFLGTDDSILYTSCFDANGGLFETLCTEEDAIISDTLNHASIIDGIRLSKAKRLRYENNNMSDLEKCLKEVVEGGARQILIATDGVFSMDGYFANLPAICDLAEKYKALVMVDDSHATGFVGKTGRGTPEYFGVKGRVDIINSTLGKALGGAVGGFTAARQEIVDLLRQRSRPYLFSNSLPPSVVAAGLEVLNLLSMSTKLRDKLESNTQRFRSQISAAGFSIKESAHPIVPIILGDARLAAQMAELLLEEGIYVIGFSFPVVPKNQARIRVQISASHSESQIDQAVSAFIKVGRQLGVIKK